VKEFIKVKKTLIWKILTRKVEKVIKNLNKWKNKRIKY